MAQAEVYSAARPGRPTLLLMLCAGAVLAALASAWVQVRNSRALGAPLRLGDSPLTVRLPQGWIADPEAPNTFHPLAKEGPSGAASASRDPFQRRVRFIYERRSGFVSPDRIAADWPWPTAEIGLPPRQRRENGPRRIGVLEGVQYQNVIEVRQRGELLTIETFLRVATSPNGDVIAIEYGPLLESSLADAELLESICGAVQLDGVSSSQSPIELQRRLGVRFPVARDWTVVGSRQDGDSELNIQAHEGGAPRWSLSVFRTWRTPNRTPQELLLDFGLRVWGLSAQEGERLAQVWSRRDGASIATLAYLGDVTEGLPISALVVSKSALETALVTAYAGSQQKAVAQQAALDLAREMTFEPPDLGWDVAAALAAGGELAKLLASGGGTPWWGRSPPTAYYEGRVGNDSGVYLKRAEAVSAGGEVSYRGFNGFLLGRGIFMLESWVLGAGGVDYEVTRQLGYEQNSPRPVHLVISESRVSEADGGGPLRRTVRDGARQSVSYSLTPSAQFVAPPLESVAEAWVAGQDGGAWIIEVSNLEGRGLSTRLLRALPRDERGRRRVLLSEDYYPRSRIVTIDEDGEAARVPLDNGYFSRLAGGKLGSAEPLFRRLVRLLED